MTLPVFPGTVRQIAERRLIGAVAVTTSPFTGQQQVQDWGGEWWQYGVECAVALDAEGRALSAFFAALGGPRQAFLFTETSVSQTVGGTPVVNGAGQTGNTLNVSGLTPSVASFRAGDFFSLGTDDTTRLYQVTANVTADGSGNAAVLIVPKLRSSPANAAALEVVAPQVALRLTSPVPAAVGLVDDYRFSFSAVEAI